ncbi:hypothetical protein ABT234_41430 [Streptomyces sp. NPDC001586]|uniref:hypothetical protein n=1 Tax=Streptomyces sp. NPDC001586 TaxID=3154387 RepID=UPI00332B08A4
MASAPCHQNTPAQQTELSQLRRQVQLLWAACGLLVVMAVLVGVRLAADDWADAISAACGAGSFGAAFVAHLRR